MHARLGTLRCPKKKPPKNPCAAQAESEQRPHKLSYHVGASGGAAKKLIAELEAKLTSAGVTAKLIYSGGVDLDILPQHASKGKGLEFLLRQVCNLF
jgi:hydroxymethylpyrimidine pyrophosphatase-like HAD family hydrolase